MPLKAAEPTGGYAVRLQSNQEIGLLLVIMAIQMISVGLYIDQKIIDQVLRAVGEHPTH